MRVVIIGPNLWNQDLGQFHVHAEGCRDIDRDPRHHGYAQAAPHMAAEATTKLQVAEFVYEDIMAENEGRLATPEPYVSEFHFAPCTKGLA